MKFIFSVSLLLFHTIAFPQITNPIPEPIKHSGLIIKFEEFVEIPASSAFKPFARINLLREAPDDSGRLFVNDLRGQFWVIKNGTPSLFANLSTDYSTFIDAPGKGTGSGAFAFHPAFAENGIFYTTHTESTGSAMADYIPLEYSEITMQWVLTEWQMDNPSDDTFSGTKREILRFDFPGNFHGMQEIAFNPNAQQGDEDYALLYVCLGDGASSLNFLENNLQTTQSFLGTIFRIDPSGNNSPNGKYGIPSSNPFFNSTETDILKEIYAYGFRNPHRISWDTAGEQKMLVGDIGEKNMEEINLILPGRNYGWGKREGTFLYERILGRENIYELPSDDSLHNYAYPVAQYDHDEGLAVVGGYVYRRDDFPELYGQYIFGDIVSGILFHTNVEDLQLGKQAEIFKIATKGADGYGTSLLAEVNDSRADLRFGKDKEGHIYVLTKSDGKIRKILDPKVISNTSELNTEVVDWLSPNPSNGIFRLGTPSSKSKEMSVQVFNTLGKNCFTAENIHTKDYLDLTHLPKGAYWVHFLVNKQEYIQLVTIH